MAITFNHNDQVYVKDGKVGIGTNSPSYKLDVSGDIRATADIYAGDDVFISGGLLRFTDDSASSYVQSADTLFIESDYDADDGAGSKPIIFRTAGNERARIQGGGDVGIGTTSPTKALHVKSSRNEVAFFEGTGSSSWIDIQGSSTELWSIGADSARFGIYNRTEGAYRFVIDDTNSYVGIGTTSPSKKLHVAGDIRVTGAYYDSNNSAGTSGQILKSTGSGTDWVSLNDITGVDGTGTANKVALWSDADTIEASRIVQDVNGYEIQGLSGRAYTRLMMTAPASASLSLFEMAHGSDENNASVVIYGRGDTSYATINSTSRGTGTTQAINFDIDGAEKMRIHTNGNVGINVTNPDRKLKVNGRVTFYEYSGSWATNIAYSNFQVATLINNSAATSGSSIGSYIKLAAAATGATGTFSDFRSRAYAENTTVNTTWLVNYLAEYRNYTSTSSVTLNNHAGLWVKSLGVGGSATVTNNYGVYLDVGTNATNNYGVYQIGSSVDNYFQGSVGIGTNSPAEKLEVSGNIKATKLLLGTTNTGYTLYSNGESRINNVIFQKSSNIDYLQKSSGADKFYVRNAVSGQSIYVGANDSGGAFDNYMLVSGANNDITFRTNGSDRLSIRSDGKVGIGTTSPSDTFEVNGGIGIRGATNYGIRLHTIENGLEFKGITNTPKLVLEASTSTQRRLEMQVSSSGSSIGFGGTSSVGLSFYDTQASNAVRMRIDNNGNVGVGTTAPYTTLDIRPDALTGLTLPTFGQSAHSGLHIVPSGTGTSEGYYGITFGNTATGSSERERTTAGIFTSASGSYGNKLYFATSSSWATGAVSRMMIDHNGNVGIGTTSPSYKLDVNGSFSSTSVTTSGGNGTIQIGTAGSIQPSLKRNQTSGGLIVDTNANVGSDLLLSVRENGTDRFNVDHQGNVGIGTTSPSQKLHVAGNIKTTGWIGSGSSNYITFDDTNNHIDFYANGVHVARMEADGDLHIKGDVIAFSDIF